MECFVYLGPILYTSLWLLFRMPAILDGEEEVRKWLDFGEVKSLDAMELLQSNNILTYHPVSSLVNNSRNNSPECVQPIDLNSKKVSESSYFFPNLVANVGS